MQFSLGPCRATASVDMHSDYLEATHQMCVKQVLRYVCQYLLGRCSLFVTLSRVTEVRSKQGKLGAVKGKLTHPLSGPLHGGHRGRLVFGIHAVERWLA